MAQGTPTSKILETISAVATLQGQVAGLLEALVKLTARVEALEAAQKTSGRA